MIQAAIIGFCILSVWFLTAVALGRAGSSTNDQWADNTATAFFGIPFMLMGLGGLGFFAFLFCAILGALAQWLFHLIF